MKLVKRKSILTKALNRAMKSNELKEHETLRDFFFDNRHSPIYRQALKCNVDQFGAKEDIPVILCTFTDTDHFLVFVPQTMCNTNSPLKSAQNKYWVCKYSWQVDLEALEAIFKLPEEAVDKE